MTCTHLSSFLHKPLETWLNKHLSRFAQSFSTLRDSLNNPVQSCHLWPSLPQFKHTIIAIQPIHDPFFLRSGIPVWNEWLDSESSSRRCFPFLSSIFSLKNGMNFLPYLENNFDRMYSVFDALMTDPNGAASH